MKWYIYVYCDQFNIPFYIGKGIKNRYLINCHTNNGFLKNKINKLGQENVKILLLHQNLSEEQAFLYEKVWIKLIGRRDLRLGSLCNLTNGGEGVFGIIHSKETRLKISQSLIGKKRPEAVRLKLSQHKISKEHKQKLREANKGISQEIRDKMQFTAWWNMHVLKKTRNKPFSEKTIEKMRQRTGAKNGFYGKKHSEQSKRKMSIAHKKENLSTER